MKRFFTFFVVISVTCALWAGNVITYTATAKLPEVSDWWGTSGLYTNAFSVSISNHTFSNGIGTITFSGEVTSIGDYAFHKCSDLTSVTIPDSVTSIGSYAFEYCSGLTSITIPNSVSSIGEGAFEECSGLTSITIPNSVTSIGEYAFYGCSGLNSVHISDITAWCGIAFRYYYDNPLYYAHYLYLNGTEITDLVIPNSVTSIGSYAFEYCSGLTSITIPNSVSSIGEGAFAGCSGLTSITIPNSVSSIGEGAFAGCSGLTSVTIPNSVTSIGASAFGNCSGLESVTIPNSVTSIGNYAFYGCSGLTSITIPNSVSSIGEGAFSDCSGLTSVTIGNSVTSIGTFAFEDCTNLDDIYSYAIVPPSITEWAFNNVSQHTPIHVPAGTARAYQKSVGWSKFLHFYEISELPEGTPTEEVGVTVTGNYATFTWPVNPTASSYTLTISKNGEVFCTLTFNSLGQLVGMAFAPGRNGAARAAEQTAYGYAFVVSGLEEGSTYHFTFASLDSQNNILTEETGSFFIEDLTTGYSSVSGDTKMTTKFLRDGQLLIQRAGTTYNLRGQQVK